MMFQILLIIHSTLRWLILPGLSFTSFKAIYNLLTNGLATPTHFKIARLTRNIVLVATLIGILDLSTNYLKLYTSAIHILYGLKLNGSVKASGTVL